MAVAQKISCAGLAPLLPRAPLSVVTGRGHQPFSALNQPRPSSLAEFKVDFHSPVGRGACSLVFAGKHVSTNFDVAIKAMSVALPVETGAIPVAEGIENENKIFNHLLSRGSHPNVVELIGCFGGTGLEAASLGLEAFKEEPVHYFVTELLEGGSLEDRIQHAPLEEEAARRVARSICEGLVSLHDQGIAHRDLKPGNVLFGAEGEATPKLIDFSHAGMMRGQERLAGELGTRGFVAPEVLAAQSYDLKCDVFSLGCLVHALLSGRPPRRHMRIGMMQQLPEGTSQEARHFLSALLNMDAAKRPSSREVLQEPWLQE